VKTVLALLSMLTHEPDPAPVTSEDALLLLERILASFIKQTELPPLPEPEGGWTFGTIREAVNELASDTVAAAAGTMGGGKNRSRRQKTIRLERVHFTAFFPSHFLKAFSGSTG
jgi:hypothetical protein